MARILLIGGHGKVALLLEPLLVAAGHHVTAVVRNPAHEADVASFDLDQLTSLVSGNDIVIWSAGAGGGSAERTYAVDRDAAIRSIDAAARVPRYLMVSYFGAGPDHGIDPSDSFYAYAESKAAADAHLRASALDWTILAPSSLTLAPPTGRIDVTADTSRSVARADVAAVIAASIDEPATIRRSVRFNTGDVPIAEALQTLPVASA